MGVMRKLRRKNRDTQYEVEPLRPQQSFPGKKMSEVLLDFAQPLLDIVDDAGFKNVIILASLCWNLSFLSEQEQQKHLKTFVDELSKPDQLIRPELEAWVRKLLERKKALFADDRRMVVDFKIVNERDRERLLVMSTLVKGELKAATEAEKFNSEE